MEAWGLSDKIQQFDEEADCDVVLGRMMVGIKVLGMDENLLGLNRFAKPHIDRP